MKIYRTEAEAIEAAEKATEDQIEFDFMNFIFASEEDIARTGGRSVFVYNEEHPYCAGMYEVKRGEMATYGLAARKVGDANFGRFERIAHDVTGEIAHKMMGFN